jgi:hypothetical protein
MIIIAHLIKHALNHFIKLAFDFYIDSQLKRLNAKKREKLDDSEIVINNKLQNDVKEEVLSLMFYHK